MTPHVQKIVQNADLFDDIREGYRWVAQNASHVKINYDCIEKYAQKIPDRAPENVFDEDHHYIGDAESTAGYILILDSINFGSGYEPDLVQEGWRLIDHSLYFTLSTTLKNYFETHGCMTPTALSLMQTEQALRLLNLPMEGEKSREFAYLCALSLRELGHILLEENEGSYLSFVESAEGCAEKMVRKIARMHHFKDIHEYKGRHIVFYKRAQITVADLQLGFSRLGKELFKNIERLTMFPDNAVPHVLHCDGILSYSKDLECCIEAGEEIPSGSEEEVELRACAGHVVELIAAHKNLSSMNVDHILWHKSAEDDAYLKTNPHRTRSRFY